MRKSKFLPAVGMALAILIAGCAQNGDIEAAPEDGELATAGTEIVAGEDSVNGPETGDNGLDLEVLPETVPEVGEDAGGGEPEAEAGAGGDIGREDAPGDAGPEENLTGSGGDAGAGSDIPVVTAPVGGTGTQDEPENAPGDKATGGNDTQAKPGDTQGQEPDGGTEKPAGSSGGADNGAAAKPWSGKTLRGARPSTAGALAVSGTRLVSASGDAVQLRGISTHGLAWFPQYVNGDCFDEISGEWGANVVRLAMYTAEYGGYCSGGDREALRELVKDGVRYAADSDMYAIVDWHILSDGDPNTNKGEAIDFFRTMSRELGGYDNVLYEICNEPNGGTTWSAVKSYALEVIPVIRENDPDAVILVGTPNWCQFVGDAAKDPIEGYDNIMYTLHFYAGTHRGDLRRAMTDAIDGGLPIFVSEYGICDASGNGALDTAEADRWVRTMDERDVSYVMWDISNKAESASAIVSSCAKTSGFEEGDLTETGRWLLRTLGGAVDASAGGEDGGEEIVEPESGGEAGNGGGTDEPVTPEADPPATGGEGIIEWSFELVNSWQGGDGEYRQYSITVRNVGDADVESWTVREELGEGVEIVNFWNGEFVLDGGTLTVTPVGYNGWIPAGGSVGDVGVIVRGAT